MTAATIGAEPTEVLSHAFDHLLALSDGYGTFEHAEGAVPRRAHGYCVDDMARVLIVIAREPRPSTGLLALSRTAMQFLVAAQGVTGRSRNRLTAEGHWHGARGTDDCWGRSIYAFGTGARSGTDTWTRQTGLASFGHAASQRSPHRRSMAFAALGAAEILTTDPHHYAARSLLVDAIDVIGPPTDDAAWPWLEPRLSYANATLAEALLAAGNALDRPDVIDQGVVLLRWLLERETIDGHLSLTPAGGAGLGDPSPAFDQQPIEAAAMADACARADAVTGDPSWRIGVDLAVGWFLGRNDSGVPMWSQETGGGFDGLHVDRANQNQGAESTIALISTMQHARAQVQPT